MQIPHIATPEPYLQVALPVPLRRLFDYLVPENSPPAPIGARVKVPFGSRELIGIIISHSSETEAKPESIKRAITVLDDQSILTKELLHLTQWAAEYYFYPIGEALSSVLPPLMRQDKALPETYVWTHTNEGLGLPENAIKRSKQQQLIHQHLLKHKQLSADELNHLGLSQSALKALEKKKLIHKVKDSKQQEVSKRLLNSPSLTLNEEQAECMRKVHFHHFQCSLLHGITGSGKTEVYLQLANKTLQAGNQVLILIPEIGLSPQTVQRFKTRFAAEVVELHSNISEVQRARNWLKAKNGIAKIIIGTRLATFVPTTALGLIIVDEEHDNSYKQHEGFRYSARDCAIYRAQKNAIPIVLGSATPSLESLNHALQKRYQHLILRHRAGGATPPNIELCDLRQQKLYTGLAQASLDAIEEAVHNKQQALVFLNRRGYAPMQLCHSCGWVSSCNRCSITMTLHHTPPHLHCHHCDNKSAIFTRCPSCQEEKLEPKGLGTEQIEQALQARFPNTRVIRIDRDSTRTKRALENHLKEIEKEDACILVGTQMLAKGHHFNKLNVVVVIDTDQGFFNPDYKSMEKTGQLLIQVAGRAGREKTQGRVVLQSYQPEHPLLQLIAQQSYTKFARRLLSARAHAALPPFTFAAMLRAESKRAENATALLIFARNTLGKYFPPSEAIQALGPQACNIEKVQDRFRFQLFIKATHRGILRDAIGLILKEMETSALSKRVRWSLDIDPIEL